MTPECKPNGWHEVFAVLVLLGILAGGIQCGEMIGNLLIRLMNYFSTF